MKALITGGALTLALLLAGCGEGEQNMSAAAGNDSAPIEPIAAPNGGNWTETVTATPEGGFLMGNPNAPVKLIEFASMTCPHCAAFSEAGADELRDRYVASGQVSFEFRNFVLNPVDAAVSVVTRCRGAGPFFQLTEQLFAEQENWYGKIDDSEIEQLNQLPPNQQMAAVIRAAELDGFFRTRGVPEAQMNQCLANQQELERLVQLREAAVEQYQVSGTPGFVVNGEYLEGITTWDQLEPELRSRIGA